MNSHRWGQGGLSGKVTFDEDLKTEREAALEESRGEFSRGNKRKRVKRKVWSRWNVVGKEGGGGRW